MFITSPGLFPPGAFAGGRPLAAALRAHQPLAGGHGGHGHPCLAGGWCTVGELGVLSVAFSTMVSLVTCSNCEGYMVIKAAVAWLNMVVVRLLSYIEVYIT